MSILTVASGKSIWRGYEYYLDKKVIHYNEVDNLIYDGKISGSGNRVYELLYDSPAWVQDRFIQEHVDW